MWNFAILTVPFLMTFGLSEPGTLVAMPDCGTASVYAVAKKFGMTKSLAEVEAALTRASGADKKKEFSLADLRKGLTAMGLHGRSVRVTSEAFDRICLPAILFIRPERLDSESPVGHFLVLQKVQDGRVTVLDLTRSASAWDMTAAELFTFWDGECLEVSATPFRDPTGWGWTAAWSLVGGLSFLGMFRLWRVPAGTSAAAVAACLAFSICGCEKPEPMPLLTFEQSEYATGEVRAGDTVKIVCAFVNSTDQKVVLKSIKACCGCMTQDNSLEGQTLEPGARKSFLVSMGTLERVGDIGGTITLITEPPSPKPITVDISAFVADSPQVVQSLPLRVSTPLGDWATIEVAIEYYRQRSTAVLSWSEKTSELQGFEVRRFDSEVQDYGSRGNMKSSANRDLLQWTFQAPADLPVGEHPFELRLDLGVPNSEPIKVPVVVEILHPIQPSLERIFFGFVSVGEEKTIDLAVEKLSAEDYSRLLVTSDFPSVTAEKREDQKQIRLRMSPSIPAGRFTGNVSLSLPDSKVPELLIPYSGIVQTGM